MSDTVPLPVLSTNGADAIHRTVSATPRSPRSNGDLFTYYELQRCCAFVTNHCTTSVALQFPDMLLPDAAEVAAHIEMHTNTPTFVMADTSYGSCCVDEVAAQHADADAIIHFGRSCLSPTSRLPVMYVFGKEPIDVGACVSAFRTLFPNVSEAKCCLFYDVVYSHVIDELVAQLSDYPYLFVSRVVDELAATSIGHKDARFGRILNLPEGEDIAKYQAFYIGEDGRSLANLMFFYNRCTFSSFDPATGVSRQEKLNVSKALMRRYFLVQKARAASVVGILVGTLGVEHYLEIITSLRELIARAGKSSYTFVIGKINEAKLANFMEIDVYVLVACPENSLLDSKEFYRPVVTVFELELACVRTKEWTGEYETDIAHLLPALRQDLAVEQRLGEEDPEFSLISGSYITTNVLEDCTGTSDAVALRNNETAVAHLPAAQFLMNRTYTGLERRVGETPVAIAVQGRAGIAASYDTEPGSNTQNFEDPPSK